MEAERQPTADAIRLSADDNVATVLRPIAAGESLTIRSGQETATILAREAVPFCHKISLGDLAPGMPVLKYGCPIGEASVAIAAGTHVHVHNLRSARAKPQ